LLQEKKNKSRNFTMDELGICLFGSLTIW